MLKWLRRQVNGDLRYWRHASRAGRFRAADVVADCKAKLAMLTWADNWHHGSWEEQPPPVSAHMAAEQGLVMAAMRRVAAGYRHRPGWRPEWDLR
jgi:hypothetical protein